MGPTGRQIETRRHDASIASSDEGGRERQLRDCQISSLASAFRTFRGVRGLPLGVLAPISRRCYVLRCVVAAVSPDYGGASGRGRWNAQKSRAPGGAELVTRSGRAGRRVGGAARRRSEVSL